MKTTGAKQVTAFTTHGSACSTYLLGVKQRRKIKEGVKAGGKFGEEAISPRTEESILVRSILASHSVWIHSSSCGVCSSTLVFSLSDVSSWLPMPVLLYHSLPTGLIIDKFLSAFKRRPSSVYQLPTAKLLMFSSWECTASSFHGAWICISFIVFAELNWSYLSVIFRAFCFIILC